MEYRQVGSSGLRVSAISLGGWLTYGGLVDQDMTEACVRSALDHGINFFDTADVYAKGACEVAMGRALGGVPRHEVVISSKVFGKMSESPNDRGLSRKHIFESIDASLERLCTDYLDIYYCHRYDPETPLEETVRAMEDLVRMGKILYWGTSVWSAGQLEDAVGVAREFHGYPPQVEQPRYHMLDRAVEEDVLDTAAKYGIGITVWSPLAEGVLTGKYLEGVPSGSRAAGTDFAHEFREGEHAERVGALANLAAEAGLALPDMALAWVLRRPEVSSAITGASKAEHVAANANAASVALSGDLLERIEGILET